MYHNILGPIDGSDTASRGLEEAIRLAGSDAEEIVRQSPVPVLLVRAALHGSPEPHSG